MDLENICRDMVHMCASEFRKEENLKELKTSVMDPCVKYLIEQFWPYIITTCIIFILMIVLCIIIVMLLLRNNKVV